jgi:excisionase family DNA binding protein
MRVSVMTPVNGRGEGHRSGNGNGQGQGQIEHVLTTLTRPQLLKAIAQLQRRQNLADVMLGLLRNELHRRLSAPTATNDHVKTFLTVKDVARELKLTRPYVYELIRGGELQAMTVPGSKRYVRVPRESLDRFVRGNAQKEA